MKEVELAELQAMLREIIATVGNREDDVRVVMGAHSSNGDNLSQTSSQEVNSLLQVLRKAPVSESGRIKLSQNEWQQFDNLYYQQVTRFIIA